MPYFLYGRGSKKYDSGFDESGGGSQSDYRQRDTESKILILDRKWQ